VKESNMPARGKEQLSRERIVNAALSLVDAEGIEGLSMRRLGAALGVDPMAVYYYVPNKEALLDVVVEAVMAEVDMGVDDPSLPAGERLIGAANAYAEVVFRHSRALPLLLARGPATKTGLAPVELMVSILHEGGLSLPDAVAGTNVVAAAVRGYAAIIAAVTASPEHHHAEERVALGTPEEFPCLSEAAALPQRDLQAQFEFGLRAIARGLLG
jgi:TetR/AcrR family transcriptional regulator, tetracycline repressor protein